jgi:GTP-binding protein
MFHDEIEINLIAGRGGHGAVSFRREKYEPKGGPDGGDGGRGGDVIVKTNSQLSDLNYYASIHRLIAENGEPGAGQKRTGADGEKLILEVPIGTRILKKQRQDWVEVADLTHDSEKKLLSGGIGGLGNVHFATATHQTPKQGQQGEAGQSGQFRFELQLIADVGIIGLPNSGKSTFLSIVSDAKPKIADYPFTTLSPVLGSVEHRGRRIVMADIPGLIQGAAQGKGLGHQFLRHIRRTRVLVHLIDSLSENYVDDYQTIMTELSAYNQSLQQKKQIVVVSKSELITDKQKFAQKWQQLKKVISPPAESFEQKMISAVTGEHISQLLNKISHELHDLT